MAYTKTPDHPDFPHGTERGYFYKCREDCCVNAMRRETKVRRLARARGAVLRADETQQRELRKHIEALLAAHPGNSLNGIERAAGISTNTLSAFMAGHTKSVFAKTVERTMAVKAAQVVPSLRYRDEALALVRQMQAAGYPMTWQTEQARVKVEAITSPPRRERENGSTTIRSATYNRLAELHARVAYRMADSERDGIPEGQITLAKSNARRAGFYPAACYDEDGTLDWRSIPDHPWTVAVEDAHKHLSRLERIVKNPDAGSRQLAHLERPDLKPMLDREGYMSMNGNPEFMTLERAYSRILSRLGIRQQDDPALVKDRREIYRQALHRFYRWGEGDPIELLLDLDLVKLTSTDLPADYPVVAKRRKAKKAQRKRNAARKQARYKARLAAKAQAETRELVAA